MFTRKEILGEILESRSKTKIYRKSKGKIFLERKNYSEKTMIVAKNWKRGLGLQTGPARGSKAAMRKIFSRVSV